MLFFSLRWDRCRVLTIHGTYVYLIEGGTNVGGTNVGGTFVGGRKVAASVGVSFLGKYNLNTGFSSKQWCLQLFNIVLGYHRLANLL